MSTTSYLSSTGPCRAIGMREEREALIAEVTEPLMRDSARGTGQYLDALAQLSGCSNPKIFGQTLQSNFSDVFYSGSSQTPVDQISSRVDKMIDSTPGLRAVCNQPES